MPKIKKQMPFIKKSRDRTDVHKIFRNNEKIKNFLNKKIKFID